MNRKNQDFGVISLLIIGFMFLIEPQILAAGRKKITTIEDKDLTIRQIIEKYYSKSNFYFGCTSKAKYLAEEGNAEKDIFLNEFSYNTPENEFKQRIVYPEPNAKWQDSDYKQLLVMARNNKQVVRAHCPISPQCSNWTKEDNRTSEELEPVMTYYMTMISKVLEANKDVVKWMDVVNETVCPTAIKGNGYDTSSISDNIIYNAGDWFGSRSGSAGWENPWTILGFETDTPLKVPTYIKLAFELANQYAPGIKKVYNHNGGMEDVAWDKVKNTILYLRSKGLKVDAVGWQAHIPYGFEKVPGNMNKLNNLIDWCYQNKLEFHVTELDIKMGKDVNFRIIKEKEIEIAGTYGAIVETMLKKQGKGAVAINCWSIKDRLSKDEIYFAGLYNSDLQPTPSYYRVKELLLEYAPGR
jgi:GH35 family endo-1,4-beta-xylanase